MIPKGTKIATPNGEGGYTLLHDWVYGMPWNEAKLFEAFGDAPRPITGMLIPDWLDAYFRDKIKRPSDGE